MYISSIPGPICSVPSPHLLWQPSSASLLTKCLLCTQRGFLTHWLSTAPRKDGGSIKKKNLRHHKIIKILELKDYKASRYIWSIPSALPKTALSNARDKKQKKKGCSLLLLQGTEDGEAANRHASLPESLAIEHTQRLLLTQIYHLMFNTSLWILTGERQTAF